jgi:FkbM family methyltransferase
MNILRSVLRRLPGAKKIDPALRSLQILRNAANNNPRRSMGSITLVDHHIWYVDLLSTASQWAEIFVDKRLRFNTTVPTSSPRILDCGGNIGMASLYYRREFPTAKITLFEADPSIFEICKKNLINNNARNVEAINAAVWVDEKGVEFFSEGSDSGTISHLKNDNLNGQTLSVPSIRLRDYLESEKIDLLKIDVEGAEFEILKDCASSLTSVSRMIIEIHDTDPSKRVTGTIIEIVSQAGFTYTIDSLISVSWKGTSVDDSSPFPSRQSGWLLMLYCWR